MSSVATYTVHEPPMPNPDRLDRADDLEFVKDGFSWITALFPPLGFALKGLWLPALAYVVAVSVFVGLLSLLGINESWSSLLVMALNIYLGFEASSVHRAMLDRASWQMLGSVSGKTLEECERRFFETWLPGQPMVNVGKPNPVPHQAAGGLWRFVSRS